MIARPWPPMSQPRGRIATKLRRRAFPVRRRLREPEDRAAMAQPPAARLAFDAHPSDLLRRQLEIARSVAHLALAIDEHARLAERDAHMIAAAFARPPGQRQQRAVGSEIAGRVVAG